VPSGGESLEKPAAARGGEFSPRTSRLRDAGEGEARPARSTVDVHIVYSICVYLFILYIHINKYIYIDIIYIYTYYMCVLILYLELRRSAATAAPASRRAYVYAHTGPQHHTIWLRNRNLDFTRCCFSYEALLRNNILSRVENMSGTGTGDHQARFGREDNGRARRARVVQTAAGARGIRSAVSPRRQVKRGRAPLTATG